MHFLELPKLEGSARAATICEAIFPRRQGARGSISRPEARFLLGAIESCDAATVVELGVASGGSTLYMLALLNELPGLRKLWAFDLDERYFADESKPVGYLARESEFNVADRFVIRGGVCAADIRAAMAEATGAAPLVDLAFIDANHKHPWTAIDFLLLLPLIREGGVVVLHDINKPLVTRTREGHGPMKLFAKPFPDRCVVPGDAPNIGAMKVSNKERMIDLAIETLAEPWEAALNPALVARIAAEIQTGPLASRAAELAPYFAAP